MKADASTRVRRNGANATLADVKAGDRVKVTILTEEDVTFREALNSPAKVISAKGPKAPAQQQPNPQPQYQLPS